MAVRTDRPTGAAVSTVGLRRLLRELEQQVAGAMRASLEPAGLTVEEWAVISLLADGLGHPMGDVGAAAGVPAPTATRLVDRLVSSALLHRGVDPADRRRVLVLLAPRGRELHARLAPGQDQLAALWAERVGEGELTQLADRLRAASTALDPDGQPTSG